MDGKFAQLNEKGIIGIIAYWSRTLMYSLPVVEILFAAIWAGILVDGVWNKATENYILSSAVITLIFSVLSEVTFILSICKRSNSFMKQLNSLSTVCTFISQLVLIYFSQDTRLESTKATVQSYIGAFPNETGVLDWIEKYENRTEAINYYFQWRTEGFHNSQRTILSFWIVAFVFYVWAANYIEDESDKDISSEESA